MQGFCEKTLAFGALFRYNVKALCENGDITTPHTGRWRFLVSFGMEAVSPVEVKNKRRTHNGSVSMKQLLEAGVHFGHQTRRWNPKMAPYIYTERNGIYIIDLQKTVKKLEEAYNFVRELAANGQSILFVGTKKQAQDAIREEATRCGCTMSTPAGSAVC